MPYSIHRSGRPCAGRSAFTLIELLIVIGIITILIVLGLSVAGKVSGTGKAHVTRDTLKVLDTALSSLIQSSGGAIPPPWVIDPRAGNNMSTFVQPIIDGRSGSASPQIVNSVGLFMLQCKSVPSAAAALKSLDSKYVREYTPDTDPANDFTKQWAIPTAFDGWGNPIRYVHPFFKGTIPTPPQTGFVTVKTAAQSPGPGDLILPGAPARSACGITSVRRNNLDTTPGGSSPDVLDADGGLNPTSRPYFYSAGPDGKVGFGKDSNGNVIDYNADNIYLTVPRVPKS